MKFWAKLIKDNQIKNSSIIETTLELTFPSYLDILNTIAYNLDIPAPLYIKSDFKHLRSYGIQKYKQNSFVEEIDFDYLEIEKLKTK